MNATTANINATTTEIRDGSRAVYITDRGTEVQADLCVNVTDAGTGFSTRCRTFKTVAGAKRWAAKQLSK